MFFVLGALTFKSVFDFSSTNLRRPSFVLRTSRPVQQSPESRPSVPTPNTGCASSCRRVPKKRPACYGKSSVRFRSTPRRIRRFSWSTTLRVWLPTEIPCGGGPLADRRQSTTPAPRTRSIGRRSWSRDLSSSTARRDDLSGEATSWRVPGCFSNFRVGCKLTPRRKPVGGNA